MASAPAPSGETRSMEDHLTCSICMDTFWDPVTTSCGHSFCKSCLKLSYECTEVCPMCKTHLRSVPRVNIVLRDIVQQRKVEKMEEEDQDEDIYTDRNAVMASDSYTEQKREDFDDLAWQYYMYIHFLEEDLGFVPSEDKQEKKSLHVCEVCGWSKMTTYRGLRVHQGKKGCIPKGKKIPQTEQGKPPKLREMEVKVERRRQSTRKLNFNEENLPKAPNRMGSLNSAAATTNNGYNSALAASQHSTLRSTKSKPAYQQQQEFSTLPRMTGSVREPPTAQPPVVRPKERRVHPTLSQVSGNRAMVESQRATVARIKEEPKSPPPPFRRSTVSAGPPPPPHVGRSTVSGPPPPPPPHVGRSTVSGPSPAPLGRATLSGPPPAPLGRSTVSGPSPAPLGRATLSGPPPAPLGRSTVSGPSPAPLGRATLSGPPPAPLGRSTVSGPAPGVRPKGKMIKPQTSQIPDSKAMKANFQATADTIKAEPTSPAVIPPWFYPGATNPQSAYQLPGFFTGVQAASSYHQPQVNGLTRESLPITPSSFAVQLKEKGGHDKVREEKLKFELQQKLQTRKEKTSRPAQGPCKNIPDPTSTSSQINSAVEKATTIQNRSVEGITGFSACPITKSVPRTTSTGQENTTAASEDPSAEGSSCASSHPETEAKQFSAATVQQTASVQPEEQDREHQKPPQTGSNSTSADQTKEDPKPYCDNAESDFSTGMKVKALARMFSATTTQETAARPRETHRESQMKTLAVRFSAITAQQTEIQPREKDRQDQKPSQTVPESVAGTQANEAAAAAATEATTKEKPASLKTTHPDVSTGLKVREVARVFSTTTTKERAGQPQEKQPLSQVKLLARQFSATAAQRAAAQPKEKVSDFSSAITNTNPAAAAAETTNEDVAASSCETAELPDFSAGMKVKDLARMFSAATAQKTIRPKEKHRDKENWPM